MERQLDLKTEFGGRSVYMGYRPIADFVDEEAHVKNPAANWPLITSATLCPVEKDLTLIMKAEQVFPGSTHEDALRHALRHDRVAFDRQDNVSTLIAEVQGVTNIEFVLNTLSITPGMPIALRRHMDIPADKKARPLMTGKMHGLLLMHLSMHL